MWGCKNRILQKKRTHTLNIIFSKRRKEENRIFFGVGLLVGNVEVAWKKRKKNGCLKRICQDRIVKESHLVAIE